MGEGLKVLDQSITLQVPMRLWHGGRELKKNYTVQKQALANLETLQQSFAFEQEFALRKEV